MSINYQKEVKRLGLFKFLKKGKNKQNLDLEAPLAPPMMDDIAKELPPFPEQELPPFPGVSPSEEQEIPEFTPIRTESLKQFNEILPNISERETKMPKLERYKTKPTLVLEGEKYEEEEVVEEYKIVHEREQLKLHKPIFVEGVSYRRMLTNISYLRTMILDGEEHLTHWNHVEDNKDTHLEHLKNLMDQTQRKLIYVDKCLFENKLY